MSNLMHKIKDAVTHDHHDKPSTSTNAGPHDSNLANKADPRVDSDRDHRAANTAAGTGAGSTNAGPHDSNLANKADPRVDSDRDHRAANTAAGTGVGSGAYNTRSAGAANTGSYGADTGNTFGTGSGSAGYGAGTGTGSAGYGAGTGTTTTGPHDSNLANKVDPRIDSDRGQYGTTGGVTAGGGYNTNPSSTNAGPHSSNLANKVDPRVDSDLDNRALHQNMGSNNAPAGSSYTTPGSGTAQQAAGPHGSNLANKLDPRVDSDLDNSRTVGGNYTRY